jgi:heterodisulfide reductase subunit C
VSVQLIGLPCLTCDACVRSINAARFFKYSCRSASVINHSTHLVEQLGDRDVFEFWVCDVVLRCT